MDTIQLNIFKKRREKLKEYINEGALILRGKHEIFRNNDVHYPFRQDSNLFYLTGFDEPDAVFVFRPDREPESILFVRPKDVEKEMWDGFHYGPEGACESFGMDAAYNIHLLEDKLLKLLDGISTIYYRWGEDECFDRMLSRAFIDIQKKQGRLGKGFPGLLDYWEILGEQRIIKTNEEIANIKKACELSADAHISAMKLTAPGMSERQIEAILEYTVKKAESPRWGYPPIVASGNNACTLHYQFNDQICQDGDLLLIDAGTEWNYYTADITRTFPVNGRFTDVQKDFYQSILDVQKSLIDQARPGYTFKDLQNEAIKGLSQVLIDWKILSDTRDDVIKQALYKKYYPHGIGHLLGMDVHDIGLYEKHGNPRPLQPGMCLTIEPGLYISKWDTSAPKALRGIGIRIEDDILICENECEILSQKAPKEVSDIESITGKRS